MFTDNGTEYSRYELWEGVVSENDDPDDTTVRQAVASDKYLLESLPSLAKDHYQSFLSEHLVLLPILG
jgi:hypothetical protein